MSSLHVYSTYSPAAGSTRVRIYDWLDHLGISADAHQFAGLPSASPPVLARNVGKVARAQVAVYGSDSRGQHVLMSREASPLSRGGIEERILRNAGHSVYDLDDALFHDASPHRRFFGGARKFERAARAADVVLAGSAYLADWAGTVAPDVRIIPSCVEPSAYEMADHEGRAGRVPIVVWLGSGSTEQFLVPLIDALLHVHRRTGARLKLISSPADNPALAELAPMMDRVAWTPDGFAAQLADADVAIAPLDDTPFARGKCAYKILQYGAAGLPVVGSPVGANRQALDRLGGTLVERADEWEDALVSAIETDGAARLRWGKGARAAVERHYSFDAWAPAWRAAVLDS